MQLVNFEHILAPNAYTIGPVKESPAYSLASRAKELRQFATPAPGSYEVGLSNDNINCKLLILNCATFIFSSSKFLIAIGCCLPCPKQFNR